MLVQLAVQNIVTIESLRFEPTPGFNVLTGETGAGKSILVDALGLVLGGRASPDLVRAGAREAEVEALFEIDGASRAAAWLEGAGLPVARELVVRRVVLAEGRSRAYVNGRLATLAQLGELGRELCDVASQHESVALTDPATHMAYLDAFGGLAEARAELARAVDELAALDTERAAVEEAAVRRSAREELVTFQLREIDELAPQLGEERALAEEVSRLRHADRLAEATRRAAEVLYDSDGALCDVLGRIASELSGAAALDAALGPYAQAIVGPRAELVELARSLGRYAEGVEVNPQRLAQAEERLAHLARLLRKAGPTTEALLAHRATLAAELAGFEQLGDRLAQASRARDDAQQRTAALARALSERRREAAERLATAVGRELALLGMGRARVVVEVAPLSAGPSPLTVDGARLSRAGIDRVEFLIAPNRGEEPRPLRRIASGGELSRALLAVKRVLADHGPAGFYVFDEVDAGVSGAIAEVIGRAIADVARHRQVLCITHLPQIAALADTHFVVEKTEHGGRTFSGLRRLNAAGRVGELARIIGGVRVGPSARRAATELLAARAS